MEEKKSIKISLGTVICMFIILILIFALVIVYYFGFVADKNIHDTNSNTVSTDNKIQFEPANYVIQFDANLLGEEYKTAGNEIKGCDYEISFLNNNKFTAYMNFGNSIEGSYTVSNNIINCIITSASGEYSPTQQIEGKFSFKINNNSEIEIIDIPESYAIKNSEISSEGWILTNETKEMKFWPLVEGIKFVSNK